MGCIMTPMPNHLSTRLTTHFLMSGGGVGEKIGWVGHTTNKRNKEHTTPPTEQHTTSANKQTIPHQNGEEQRESGDGVEEKSEMVSEIEKGRRNGTGSHCAHCEQGRKSCFL